VLVQCRALYAFASVYSGTSMSASVLKRPVVMEQKVVGIFRVEFN
jgi:hypothetical protein